MPHHIERRSPRQRQSKAQQARQYLTAGGVTREDSDDELGLEDHPWEWIFEDDGTDKTNGEFAGSYDELSSSGEGDAAAALIAKASGPGRKRKISQIPKPKRNIIGARMGNFECKVGECVLLKAEGTNEAWVGIIVEFSEDEDEKSANFMWFATDKEIRNKEKKRTDALKNELYITPSWDFNPLASINGKASINSPAEYLKKHPSGNITRNSRAYGKTFICRRGCNTRTATYTDEFIWEEIFNGSELAIHNLIQRVKSETKATRKRRFPHHKLDADTEFVEPKHNDGILSTPRKKQKTSAILTPRKPKTPSKLTTPSHKRVVIKKPLEFTPLATRVLSPGHVQASPFQIARSKLHVSSVPASLPCREEEFMAVYSHLEAAITDGSGACIYISGTPGTGKTATVREVVSQMNAAVDAEELDDFIFVEINGMKVTDPHQSYSLLWEALKGDRVSPSHALDLLEREFNNPSPRRVPCVVLMDELDQLVTKNQTVMYNFFNWPGLRHSRLIVLAVANTMDLPERTLSNKISSRLGLTRITFPGYNHAQLMKIIQSRLEGVPGNVVDVDAVQFASRKVAAVSGDARRALDICRRAVELAEADSITEQQLPTTPSKRKKGDGDGALLGISAATVRVTIATIKRAINEATSSPLQQYLRSLPLSSKVFLAALLAKTRRTGLTESVLGEVVEEAKRMAHMASNVHISEYLLVNKAQPGGTSSALTAQSNKAPRLLIMGAAAIELTEAGVIGLEARRGERTGKVRLNIGEEEVKLALKDDPEVRGLGFSS